MAKQIFTETLDKLLRLLTDSPELQYGQLLYSGIRGYNIMQERYAMMLASKLLLDKANATMQHDKLYNYFVQAGNSPCKAYEFCLGIAAMDYNSELLANLLSRFEPGKLPTIYDAVALKNGRQEVLPVLNRLRYKDLLKQDLMETSE